MNAHGKPQVILILDEYGIPLRKQAAMATDKEMLIDETMMIISSKR